MILKNNSIQYWNNISEVNVTLTEVLTLAYLNNKKTMDFKFSKFGYLNGSSKFAKGKTIGVNTYAIYFAPYNLSGRNVCAMATKECITGCLNTSGRVKMDVKNLIVTARINRTNAFYEHREASMIKIISEIDGAKKKSKRQKMDFAVRLNGTSDLSPEIFKAFGQNILELFPNVQFYDYTKIPNRLRLAEKYKNYHLTFSHTGQNWNDCVNALESNVNVAVIFDTKKGQPLPKTFNGYKVIDGDLSDYRPGDTKKRIVGLRWKDIKNRADNAAIKDSMFVVKTNSQQHVTLTEQCTLAETI